MFFEKVMSIHKDKKRNTWYVKYNNKTKRGFINKKDAIDYEAKLKSGVIVACEENLQKVLFSEVANEYKNTKKKELAYSSYISCVEKVDKYILPNFENKTIDRITRLDCKIFKDKIYDVNLSTGVKNAILNHFKNIFIFAQRYYGLNNNPTQFIESFKRSFEEKMKSKEKEMSVWTDEEFNRFIVCVNLDKYKDLFIVLYYTGLRLGEAMALNWKDLKDHKLIINKSMTKISENGSYEIKDTKNISSIREVSLNDLIYKYLKLVQKSQMSEDDFSYSWFIFGGKKPLSRTRITNAKDKAIKKSGVKRITIHEFRHSHASNLINEGVNIVAVSRRLGHSDVNMTLKVYTHLFKKNDDILVDYLEKSSQNLLNIFSQSSHKTKS